MDNINNNNNMAGNSQSDVDTYNSIQPSSQLMDNNVSNMNSTPASDDNVKTESTDSSLIENLAGAPSVVESNAPVEQFPQQEPSDTLLNGTSISDGRVGTADVTPNLAENLAGTSPVVESYASVEQFPQLESANTVSPEFAGMPSFGSIPVMGESVTSSPVPEQPVEPPSSTESSFDMSTPLSQPAASAPVSPDTFPESPSNLTSSTPSEPVSEAPSTPAFNETEIVNTLGNEKKEKEGGNTVVIILIIVIVALLIAVGYFAYKVFLA